MLKKQLFLNESGQHVSHMISFALSTFAQKSIKENESRICSATDCLYK